MKPEKPSHQIKSKESGSGSGKKDTSKKKVNFKKAFKDFIWPRKGMLAVGLILIGISTLSSFVIPLAMTDLIDNVRKTKDYDRLYMIIAAVIGSLAVRGVASFLLTKLLSIQAQKLIADLRVKVQEKVLQLPINFFDNHKSGELVSRVMTDVEGVRNLVGTGLVQLVGGTLTSVVAIVMLVRISPSMTLYTLVPIVIFAMIAMKAFAYIRPIFRERGKINAEVTGRLTETLNGVRVIKGFNAEKQEIESFRKGVYRLYGNVKKTLTSNALIVSSSIFLLGVASAIILYFGAIKMMEGTLEPGQLTQFLFLLALMVAPIVQISNIGTQLTEALAGLDRTEEIMEMKIEDDGIERDIILDQAHGDIQFNNVSFAYEEDKEVIHNISFEAPAGSVTALVGSSGSGKSTIAGLASTFMKPDSGTITIDGKNLSKITLNSYRQYLGVVLQDDFLFEGTIRENILFPRPDATEEQLEQAVKAGYVNEFTDRFEEGLETVIGERGVKLSGGQRQRIAIARAILADPKILILDEATSNLDTESETLIQKSLAELMKGRTTFVIAHRLSTIRKADQILVIEQGKIEEQGTHDELIASEGRYFDLYTYQARI